MASFRERIGCWLNERWKAELVLHPAIARRCGISWVDLCNRNESVGPGGDEKSRTLNWDASSYLTVSNVFPEVGGRLLRHCHHLFPFQLNAGRKDGPDETPELSVIIPFQGEDRWPQLICALKAFFAQSFSCFEILIVGPDLERMLRSNISDSRIRVIDCSLNQMEYCKSYYLNKGVGEAASKYILIHDADILVPKSYLENVVQRLEKGWEAVHPIRLLFYLGSQETKEYIRSSGVDLPKFVRTIRANFAGGSIAMTKLCYENIGGMDEGFLGWGLEDVEFFQRLKAVKIFPGRFSPAIHLWHPVLRECAKDSNVKRLKSLSSFSDLHRKKAILKSGSEKRK